MKSVLNMFIVFIGLYIIVASGVLDFCAQKIFFRIAIGSVFFMLFLFVALVGTPFSKPFIKLRGKKNEKDKNLN